MRKKEIAPKLASGRSRERLHLALPPAVKRGVKMAAHAKGISANWLMEQRLLRSLGLETPEYVERKRRRLIPFKRAS